MSPEIDIPVARLHDIGTRLKAAGYDEASIAAAMGVSRLGRLAAADVPLHERRLAGRGPLATLIQVFHLGKTAQRAELDSILGANGVDALAACNLVDIRNGRVVPRVQLTPFDALVVAHDPETGIPASDHVAGISPSSRMLYHLTVRAPVARALDIGTGCGVQAFALARHAEHVVGTDINPRALWLARCNAALNGIANIEWRQGSLLEPVAGERFELVVANPPFVISPDAAYVFRDAGSVGDVSQALVTTVHRLLQPGGYAQLLLSWPVGADGDWQAAPRRWVRGNRCDAWLLYTGSEDGLTYAAKSNGWLRDTDSEAYGAALDRWTAYYTARGAAALAAGAITLRRRSSGRPWWHAERIWTGPVGEGGKQVHQVFRARDHLGALSDARALLGHVPRFAGDHRLEQRMRYRAGGYAVETTEIVLDDSAGVAGPVDPQALLVLLGIDGQRTVRELIGAASDGWPEAQTEALEGAVLTTLWQLAERGVITFDTGP